MSFNPMTDVPKTDEQAMIALERNDDLLTSILQGLYRCYHAQNNSVVEAFRLTLEDHVKTYDAKLG